MPNRGRNEVYFQFQCLFLHSPLRFCNICQRKIYVFFRKRPFWVSNLTEYYFDMETTGLDPEHDKIITIQTQRLVGRTGEPIDEVNILKEWESSEKEIIKKIMPCLTCENPFDFIIVGKNLLFDFMFLNKRAEKYGFKGLDLRCFYNRASIDLKPVLVMINNGNFKGYDRVLDKEGKLADVMIPQLYEEKKYQEIVEYIKEEAKTFVDAYQKLRKKLPSLAKHL